MQKKITILIITHNGRKYISDCLSSVTDSNYPKDLIKIIVVDNGSTDSTIDFVREKYPQVKIVENRKNLGFAEANNQGHYLAQKNRSDYLVLLNQDTIVNRDWLTRLIELADSDNKIAVVQPKIMLYPQKDRINSLGNSTHFLGFSYCNKYKEKDSQDVVAPVELPHASGAACLIRMSVIKKADLFDDRLFMYYEDVDLGWRLNLAGYKVMLEPKAVVYHKYSFSKAKYKFYYTERNRWVVILQNYRVATLILIFPALMVMELGIILLSIVNGWFWQKLRGCFWIFCHWPSILSHRIDVQFKIRKVKDKEILKLFVGSIRFQETNYWILNYIVNPLMIAYLWLVKRIIFW